jgi:thiamine biosynthesis lipoprotein ApbE
MTRDEVAKAFRLSPDLIDALEEAGVLTAGADGQFDLAVVAGSLFNYGMARARAADEKLTAVAGALNQALPALQRLSTLPDAAKLQGDVRQRVTLELSAFFTAFSELLVRATEALQDGGRDAPTGGRRRTNPR